MRTSDAHVELYLACLFVCIAMRCSVGDIAVSVLRSLRVIGIKNLKNVFIKCIIISIARYTYATITCVRIACRKQRNQMTVKIVDY